MFSSFFGSCFKRSKTMTITVTEIPIDIPSFGANPQRYKKVSKIGSGGFAKVWKAVDIITNEEVAMKVSSTRYTNSTLEKEFFILRKMNNPHILSPIAFYYDRRSQTTTHLILPFMNKDLYTHVVEEQRYMSEKDLRKLVLDIATAIKHIHDLDIVHRDIKPENILIDDNGDYVLCDFGHAENVNCMSLNGLKGSLFYMAPEVAAAHVKRNTSPFAIGKQIDIFSFGMTIHNVATHSMGGASPETKREHDFIDEISRFDMMPQIDELIDRSDSFRDLLKMMLYRSPIARITVEEILEHPFVTGR